MIENTAKTVTLAQLDKDLEMLRGRGDYYLAEIDGVDIVTPGDFFDAMWKVFQMPGKYVNWPACFDWLRDLSWIDTEGFILIIYNHKNLLYFDPRSQKFAFDFLTNDVLQWWQHDIVNCVVEGEPKPFNVFFVE